MAPYEIMFSIFYDQPQISNSVLFSLPLGQNQLSQVFAIETGQNLPLFLPLYFYVDAAAL